MTEVKPVLEALARTLERINRDKGLSIGLACPDGLKFRGERQDLEEMVGNLLDNACKWAAGQVALSAAPAPGLATAGRSFLVITVEDDGPGLPPEKRAEALKRGQRLDEIEAGLRPRPRPSWRDGGHVQRQRAAGTATLGGLRADLSLPSTG